MSCLSATAELVREEIDITAECDCGDITNNALRASDGFLYSSELEPLFTTE